MTRISLKCLVLFLCIFSLLAVPVTADNITNETSINETLASSNVTESSISPPDENTSESDIEIDSILEPLPQMPDENIFGSDNDTDPMAELLSKMPEELWGQINPESLDLFFNPSQSYNHSYSYGYIPDPTKIVRKNDNENRMLLMAASPYAGDLPSAYRSVAASKIENQYPYGTCWAFSTIAAAEANILNKTNPAMRNALAQTLDLSETQAIYFFFNRAGVTKNDVLDEFAGLSGDDIIRYQYADQEFKDTLGANSFWLVNQMISGIGLMEEKDDFTYTNIEEIFKNGIEDYRRYTDYASSQNAYYVVDTTVLPYIYKDISTRNAIKRMLMTNGGAVMAFEPRDAVYENGDVDENAFYDFSVSWKETISRTYYRNNVTHPLAHQNVGGHAMCLVGWDDDYPIDNFKVKPNNKGAWLLKNSWGSSAYDDGYLWISYEDDSIGKDGVMFLEVTPTSEKDFDYIYQYDGGVFDKTYPSSSSITARNVFTANGNQKITHVSFETVNSNVEYTINIMKNGGETSLSTKSGSLEYQGYHTIELDTPVSVSYGDTFDVRVTLKSKDGNRVSFPADTTYATDWIEFHSSAVNTKSSYYTGTYRGSWTDITSSGDNFRIKAFAKDVESAYNGNIIVKDTCGNVIVPEVYLPDYNAENPLQVIISSNSGRTLNDVERYTVHYGYQHKKLSDITSVSTNTAGTRFVFEGFPRGDVTLDGMVLANDASMLGSFYANPSSGILSNEQLFYANIKGSVSITLIDVRLIAQYAAGGIVDANYKNI